MTVSLEVDLAGLHLRNPVMTASGTAGYGSELAEFFPLSELGAFITKAITREPREGNPPPRLAETRAGMINAIGLANVGLEAFVAEKLPWLREQDVPVVVNVAGSTIEEYVEVARRLDEADGVDGIELNISCPNVRHGGMEFGRDESATREVVSAVRAATPRTVLLVKLSPNVTDVVAVARAAIDSGADALTLINTLSAIAVDARKRRPVLTNVFGGLSGPAIKPVALRMVYEVYHAVARDAGVPIVGVGGIQQAEDAAEFLLAGASAVQVGTAGFVDPAAAVSIVQGLEQYLADQGLSSVRELTGALSD